MRIALITRRYPPECCGVGDYTSRLAESWQRQGHEVTVFVGSHGENGIQKAEARNQKEPKAKTGANEIRVVRIALDGWNDVAQAVQAIREARPEAVQFEYSNYGWSRWGFAFWLNRMVHELHRANLRVTIAMHEFPLEFRQHPRLAGIAVLQRLHYALLVMDADEVLTNTRERVRILRRWFPRRRATIHYRPNSSHIPVAEGVREQIAALRAGHAEPGALVVTTFGTYHRAKNFEAVIEAASELRRERPLALWLLGDASPAQPAYMEMLRARIRELGLEATTWWSGRMEPAEISACLQASDLFVLPQPDGHLTRSSAFMAAAGHGLPVIAVRNAENQTDFAHGDDVWLVEESRGDLMAQAMEKLAEDAELRARLGRNLRALYEKKFAWEVAARPRGGATLEPDAGEVEVLEPQMNTEKHR